MSKRSFVLMFVFVCTFFMAMGYVFQLTHYDKQSVKSALPQDLARQQSKALPQSNGLDQNTPGHPQEKTAVIAFTFDDGYLSDYELAYPLFKKYGIKGTSYIIGKYPDNDIPDTMTWAQIKEMHEYGWDFGSHTYSHINLTKLDNDQIDAEVEQENASFLHHGLPLPQILAFPYGAYNLQVIDALKNFYVQMRKAFYQTRFVDMDHVDPYQIDCISADMQAEGRLHSCEKLVDKACEEKAVIVFRVHCMYREKRDDMGHWPVQTSYKMFEQFVDYCVQKGCTFVTMDELMNMYSKLKNATD